MEIKNSRPGKAESMNIPPPGVVRDLAPIYGYLLRLSKKLTYSVIPFLIIACINPLKNTLNQL
jgi:hypothetical protein